jgi:hypothetical protein
MNNDNEDMYSAIIWIAFIIGMILFLVIIEE